MKIPTTLPRSLVNQLLHLAQATPNREICGLVGAQNGVPASCYPIANVAEQPATRFLLDSQSQINAMRTMREKGETLFAIFHSHPAVPAQPSVEDIAQAVYAEALYLVISLNTKGVLELRGFRQKPNTAGFTEETVALEQD